MSPDRRKPRSDHARVPPPRSPPSSCVSVSALLPLDVVRGLGLQGYDLRGFRCNTLSLDTGFPTPQVHEGRARGTLGRRTSNSFFSAPLFLTASGREYHAGGGSSGSEECRPHNMGFDHLHQCPILPHFSLADRQGQHHSSVYNVDTLTCRRIKLDYCTEHGCTLFRWKAKGGRARRLSTGHVTNSMRPFILFGLQLVDGRANFKLTVKLSNCQIGSARLARLFVHWSRGRIVRIQTTCWPSWKVKNPGRARCLSRGHGYASSMTAFHPLRPHSL